MAALLAPAAAQADTVSVASPDGTVRAILSDESGTLRYRMTVDGRAVLDPSPLGLRINGVELGESVTLGTVERRRTNSRYRFVGGKAEAIDRANVAAVTLRSHGIVFMADLHVADDGIAVRLRLPARPGQRVEADRSGWKLAAADPRV